MKASPEVMADRLGLIRGSKGAELALLAASRTDDFLAVAVLTPAAHSREGHTMRFFSPDYRPVASWSEGGKPLPFVSFKVSPENKAEEMRGELESFVFFFKDAPARADAAAVEKGGHNAVIPFLVTANRGLLLDGDPGGEAPAADARGGYRSWAETLDFLRRHLS